MSEPRTDQPAEWSDLTAEGRALATALGRTWVVPDWPDRAIFRRHAEKVTAELAKLGYELRAVSTIRSEAGPLDEAWAEAEAAAAARGKHVGRLIRTVPTEPERWLATARWGKPNQNYNEQNGSWADTPAAALRALAARLSEEPG